MIGISKLYCGTVEPSDVLRYNRQSAALPAHLLQFSHDKKPVVVWNVTKACNLKCVHCYSHSNQNVHPSELSTQEGMALLDDLASFGVPVILFSGGEPLLRKDLALLVQHARSKGMRVVISTNGTLISKEKAAELKALDVSYVGISIDGLASANDNFRRVPGAFAKAVEGIRNCQVAGIKVGLRFTITKMNYQDIDSVFAFLEEENIPRICFYHLAYTGRAVDIKDADLSHVETRGVLDTIMARTADLHARGKKVEVLTVDNHADGVYLYLKMKKEDAEKARDVLTLLTMNGGNSTGIGIGCVSWNGDVHPDQFWRHYSFGNVKQRAFSDIWPDVADPMMKGLKNRKSLIKGRCAACAWLSVCNANLRVRAEATTGDVWGSDPACYLDDNEISGEDVTYGISTNKTT